MIRLTIKEAIKFTGVIEEPCTLYMVRDGETVFYIGKSGSPINRILQHMGLADHFAATSPIGRCILANAPESDEWLFEMYTVDDCAPFFVGSAIKLPPANVRHPEFVDIAEMQMIKYWRPCLNIICNRDASPIPAKYRDWQNCGSSTYLDI